MSRKQDTPSLAGWGMYLLAASSQKHLQTHAYLMILWQTVLSFCTLLIRFINQRCVVEVARFGKKDRCYN